MEERNQDELTKIYYDVTSAGAYGGINRLYDEVKRRKLNVSRKAVANFLADEQAYSLHKPARRNYKRNKTYVSGIDAQWQADLADMKSLSKSNDGFKYLLTCIDVFSKFAWAIPIKNKGADATVLGFKKLFELAGNRRPKKLQTDKGNEFICEPVQKLLQVNNILHFSSNSDKKAAVVERFNRTLKTRIWTYFTAKNTERYIDVLPQLVEAYNNSRHRSIGMAPAKVRRQDTNVIWQKLYGDGKGIQPGELVRLNRWKGNFEKGYLPNWSKEVFHVTKVFKHPVPTYEVHDKEGEEILGNFYGKELQRIKSGEYVVEKILKKRRVADGTYEVLVKWEGWPAKYNSWIPKESLENHK
jgi:transposase InsO family protein